MNNMNRFITFFIVFFVTVFAIYSQTDLEMLKNGISITVSKKGKLEKKNRKKRISKTRHYKFKDFRKRQCKRFQVYK